MDNTKKIHFMGIGGSGMNAAAGIAYSFGYTVTGCDVKESEYTADLVTKNIQIVYGHSPDHISHCDLLCVTPAVFDLNKNHEELLAAHDSGVPVMTWQQFMGEELQKDKRVIAVAGTKGKTTTTALVGYALECAHFDPTVAIGGIFKNWDRNYRVGEGSLFVCEADEYNNSFLHYSPDIAVITNLEMDHPEFFSSYKEYTTSFVRFISQVRSCVVVCTDSSGVGDLLVENSFSDQVVCIGYGLNTPSQSVLDRLSAFIQVESFHENSRWSFSMNPKFNNTQHDFSSIVRKNSVSDALLGDHNVLNAAAAEIVTGVLNATSLLPQNIYEQFLGVGRRLELVCDQKGIRVYNDYAHNPMSVNAALRALRQSYPDSRIWAIFQPHMYSRTKLLLDEFALSFGDAHAVVISDIYASREKGKPVSHEIHSTDLVARIHELNPSLDVRYMSDMHQISSFIVDRLQPGDIVINMGAGDNGIISEELCQKIQ